MNPIELNIFASRLEAICDEMGVVLRNASFSPNIRDRLDFSCAVFDAQGALCAQAAHIPVHLGSMAYAMADIVSKVEWHAGDMVVLNDPFMGGTHLPDVTLIAPLFYDDQLTAFLVNRAHHADIGASSPGSMPVSRTLEQEGRIIAPGKLVIGGQIEDDFLAEITRDNRNPGESNGDFAAQISANRSGLNRLELLIDEWGRGTFLSGLDSLNAYAERLAREALKRIPVGEYSFEDCMDDDGQGNSDIPICVRLVVEAEHILVNFTGTAQQVPGNINCPLSVAAAAVYYVFRCLMPAQTPACAGSFRPIELYAPQGCLLNAKRPAAVAAGNVETSTRVVDVVLGALAQVLPDEIPAASHGSMNNLAMGSDSGDFRWDYYETIGGGMGAGRTGGGLNGVQTHMTNTLNTPIEVIETRFPVQIKQYGLRHGSAGKGARCGGEGVVRTFKFLAPTQVTLLTERRSHQPWGSAGGQPGEPGINSLNGKLLPAKVNLMVGPGDQLTIETPGGGGWGSMLEDCAVCDP
ncbi:MAG: hydantoinase B/oxoprolinase family protein [Candidatus Thiodiazotropha sp. (ex Lucinoma borealis)]|nr:hydantoinase B/oxoprolinase family protein [Candidatus Thiodiazotropha sp. (ex Lucinoma borealis)]MCU7862662.1 hydantoinase B/oxoprolinase family protein [Candidatus Thiodiazotropha sp. (ex Lucinoma borealis)]